MAPKLNVAIIHKKVTEIRKINTLDELKVKEIPIS